MLRSFAKAKEYIYIDQSTMSTTEAWLKKKQQENGCYELVGALFNRRMKVSVVIIIFRSGLNVGDARRQTDLCFSSTGWGV